MAFREAVTECPTVTEEKKLELLMNNHKAEIAEAVKAKSPSDTEDAIWETVRAVRPTGSVKEV